MSALAQELAFAAATELVERIRLRDLSPVEVVDAFLERIEDRNPDINAYVLVLSEEARHSAREAVKALMSGQRLGSLHGLPIAIKDLFDFKAGVPNTFGCLPFQNWVPTTSATYVSRLESAGAIVLGKTNTPEFGHRGITDNYLFGPTSTPFRIGKNAGGSSGGSAAAVAAGLAPLAQGSDGGGSIRIPAAWCGVYGIKPSFGRVAAVARPDGFSLAVPFAQAGPIARSVADAALMLGVMAGPDDRDPYSLPADGADYLAATRRGAEGLRVAWTPDFGVFPVEPEVARVTREAVRTFEEVGAHVDEVAVGFKHSQDELCAAWIRQSAVRAAESAAGFKAAGIDLSGAHRAQISPQFATMLDLGAAETALHYRLDDVVRTQVLDAVQDVLDRYDLLVSPTLAALPVDNAGDGNTLGPTEIEGERVDPLLGWCLTYVYNFTGHPAASLPAGLSESGLPVGLQVAGRRFADETVLAASGAYEAARPWTGLYPPIAREGGHENRLRGHDR
jgi:amidase/aspartyl-tRNA(Asn)/glutamyl-tRNA(Gln) amidotransferase subunit A